MAYQLKEVTLRTDNSPDGMKKIAALWKDKGEYDLSIRTVTAEFFASLEKDTAEGKYFKLETTGETVQDCTALAWQQVWRLSTEGKLKRAFATDIESSVPKEYTKDGKAHCYLYISLRKE